MGGSKDEEVEQLVVRVDRQAALDVDSLVATNIISRPSSYPVLEMVDAHGFVRYRTCVGDKCDVRFELTFYVDAV